jgi:DNA-binding transcriptional LysR family regulator
VDNVSIIAARKFGSSLGFYSARSRCKFLSWVYLAAVQEGLGQAVIPMHLLELYSGLQRVKDCKIVKTPVYLYYSKQPFYSRLHKLAIEAIRSEVPKRLGKEA